MPDPPLPRTLLARLWGCLLQRSSVAASAGGVCRSPRPIGRGDSAGRHAGVSGWLREGKVRFHARTVERLVAWAGNVADADPLAPHLSRVWQDLHDDWQAKTAQIERLE